MIYLYMSDTKIVISSYRHFVLKSAVCSCHFQNPPYLIQQDKQKFLVSFLKMISIVHVLITWTSRGR